MTKQEYSKQSREMVSAVGPWTIGSRAPLFDIPKDWNPFRPGRKHEEWNDGFDATNESLDAMHNTVILKNDNQTR